MLREVTLVRMTPLSRLTTLVGRCTCYTVRNAVAVAGISKASADLRCNQEDAGSPLPLVLEPRLVGLAFDTELVLPVAAHENP